LFGHVGQRTRRFYYLLKTDPPTREQFLSYHAQGKAKPPLKPRQIDRYKSISVWETPQQARDCAAGMSEDFKFIAALDVPDDAPVVRIGRPGHHEIRDDHATPERLQSWVAEIVPVQIK
jgi:hypothetical protein